MSEAFKVLTKEIVVDSAALKKLGTIKLAAAMAEIYSHKLPVAYVDSFFDLKKRSSIVTDILNGEDISRKVEFIRGAALTDAEYKDLASFKELHAKVLNIIANLPEEKYPFAEIPEGKSIDTYCITERSIKRSQRADYSIGATALKTIFESAKRYWAGVTETVNNPYIRASGYAFYAKISKTAVECNCQTLQRWEIEQIALKLGWSFDLEDTPK